MRSRWYRWALVLPPIALLLWCGFRGLDFGEHWDERLFVLPLKRFAKGSLMPGAYNYPSLAYYLSYLAAIPNLVDAALNDWAAGMAAMDKAVDTTPFRLRIRGIYLVLTSVSLVWIFGAVLASGRRAVAAFAATMVVAASFEVSYHSRWFAPDGPLLTFSAFTIWALVRAERATEWPAARRALVWAAVGAALATGTKYTAGLYLFVVLALAVVLRRRFRPEVSWLRTLTVPFFVYGGVYLLTTPATLFDTRMMLEHIEDQRRTYGGGFFTYTVDRGFDHLSRMVLYLGGELFSPYVGIAVAIAAIGIVGAVHMLRAQRTLAIVVFAVPLMFIAVFTSQRTMIVRNLLVLLPSLALGVAWGVDWLLGSGSRARAAGVALVIAALLAVNVAYVLEAAEDVRHRMRPGRFAREAAAYVRRVGPSRVYVSPGARRRMRSDRIRDLQTARSAQTAELLMFLTDEGFDKRNDYPANYWQLTEVTFGPHEVSFDRYPTFFGRARFLVMRAETARAIDLALLAESP